MQILKQDSALPQQKQSSGLCSAAALRVNIVEHRRYALPVFMEQAQHERAA